MNIPFNQARYYTQTASGRPIDLIVAHDMEAPEARDTAENVAAWFAGSTSPRASAHYLLDIDSVVQGVRDRDVAWHAPGANHNGIGIEHAGYAAQTARDWADPYSEAMLSLSATLVAGLCATYQIPTDPVDVPGLLRGQRGITTHAAVSVAFRKSDHTDPGPNFPMARYIDLVRAARLPALPPQPGGPDVSVIIDAIADKATGGVWVFARDGGVFAYHGAPFKGSYPGLPAKDRQGDRYFVSVELNNRGGYDMHANDGASYSFPV